MSDYNVGKLTFDLDVNKTKFTAGLRASELEAAASATKTQSKIKGIGDETEKTTRKVNGLSSGFRGLGTAMVAAVGGMFVIDQMKQMVGAASDLNEAINMTGLVFGESKDEILAWSEGAAAGFGLARTEALQSAAGFANLFLNVGMAADEATAYSQTLVERAADMASAFNTTVPDAIQAMSAGLRGEAEPLRRYGVMLDDVTLKTKALEMGLFSGKGILDQNAKAQAAYAIILEKTSRIQGDFANTADDPANAARILTAQITDLRAAIGEELLPVWRDLLNTTKDVVVWAKENTTLIKGLFELTLKLGLVLAAMKAWRAINTALITSNAAVAASATTMGAAMQANLAGIAKGAGKAIGALAALEVLTRGIGAGSDNDRNAEYIRIMSEANPEYNGDLPWYVQSMAGFENLLSGVPVVGELTGSAEIFRQVDDRLSKQAEAEAQDDVAKAMREAALEAERLALGQDSLTVSQDAYTRALERHNKAQDDAKAAIQAYRDALAATKADVLGAVTPFGEVPGAGGVATADAQAADARRALAEAEAELARVSRYHQAGSQTVADARSAVADATQALADANSAADEARGLSQQQLLERSAATREYLRQQARDVKALRAAELSDDALSALLDLEQSSPGTIRRVVEEGISKPFVDQLNKDFEKRNAAAEVIARQLNEAMKVGVRKAREAATAIAMEYHRAWMEALGYTPFGDNSPVDGIPESVRRRPQVPSGEPQGLLPIPPGGTKNEYNINGEVRIETNDPEGVWEGVRRRARIDALGGR